VKMGPRSLEFQTFLRRKSRISEAERGGGLGPGEKRKEELERLICSSLGVSKRQREGSAAQEGGGTQSPFKRKRKRGGKTFVASTSFKARSTKRRGGGASAISGKKEKEIAYLHGSLIFKGKALLPNRRGLSSSRGRRREGRNVGAPRENVAPIAEEKQQGHAAGERGKGRSPHVGRKGKKEAT